ncbi:10055_t:CDS:2, partial [Racocetra fulgida]
MLLKACGNYKELFEKYEGPYDGYGEEKFILVDTPGFTNEKTSTNKTWIEINKAIDNSYEHGIRAFLFVLGMYISNSYVFNIFRAHNKGRRFTSDRRSHLDECMKKLNNENVIIVFTKCTKEQTEIPKNMKDSFADFINEHIKKVNNRWVVAPNPDIYDECNDIVTNNVNYLKTMISEIKKPWKRDRKSKYGSLDNTLEIIKLFGDQSISNKIVAFTKLEGNQIKRCTGIDKKSIEKHLKITSNTTALLKSIGYNWIVFPNPEFKEEIISESMNKIEKMIET